MTQSCRLYLVSPPKIELTQFTEAFKNALSGGDVACLQLRLKEASDAEILEAGRALLPICREHGVAFIINDRIDLAKQIGADGVHLGQEDLEEVTIEDARRALGRDAVIGATCHASRHLALEAAEQGADYVAFGAFYPTASKPKEKLETWGTPELEILTWWQEMMELPCVAIGGMTPERAGDVAAAGADFIAAITAVWCYKKGPQAAVRAFNSAMRND